MHRRGLDASWIERGSAQQEFFKRLVIAVGAVVVCVQWVRLGISPRGDFDVHWELGRRLVAHEFMYQSVEGGDERGHDYPYPPFWALAHAPLTAIPTHVAQLLVYPLFIVALIVLMGVLQKLTRGHLPLSRDRLFWSAVAAVFLSSRFLIRDMPECGVNLALVALSWLAVSLWVQRREILGGVCLGLAISLKCTPALFLVYFVWKRQWKMVAATTTTMTALSLSPAIWMGPTEYVHAIGSWFGHTWPAVGEPDPSQGVLGEEPVQNISLRPALARYLMHLPEGHRSRLKHPLYFDVFNFRPDVAGFIVKILIAALLATVAWKFRNPVGRRDDPVILWECAAISVMILLCSPITWGQHCVGVLPAFYLITQTLFARGGLPGWMNWLLGAYTFFILGLNRSFVGKEFTLLLDSYRVHTWCFLALLLVIVGCRSRSRSLSVDDDNVRPLETSDANHLPQVVAAS